MSGGSWLSISATRRLSCLARRMKGRSWRIQKKPAAVERGGHKGQESVAVSVPAASSRIQVCQFPFSLGPHP